MSVALDLTTAAYLLFRLLPFLVATVMSLAPLLVFSWKGAPYLFLLLLTLAAASALGGPLNAAVAAASTALFGPEFTQGWQTRAGSAAADSVCSAFVLGSGAQPYSVAAPLDVALLTFSTLYLTYFMTANGLSQYYRVLQVTFAILTAAYTAFLLYAGCTPVPNVLVAAGIGSLAGWYGGAFVAAHMPSLMYLAAPSSRQSCTRVSDTVYTCRGGDPNQSAD